LIRTLDSGTAVSVLEHNTAAWSKVSVNGEVGYIRSDFLSTSSGRVELLPWSEVRTIIKTGAPIHVVDVRTGLTYTIKCFSIGAHADVETVASADTDVLNRVYGGTWSWDPRPVWVTIEGRTIAASINGMPHAGETISGNGMNGHVCLHFYGSLMNGTRNISYANRLQAAVMEAYEAS